MQSNEESLSPDGLSLAFTNLSDERSNEYFSAGISEELLTVLQKMHVLHVQKAGGRVNTNARLSRVTTSQELWSKSFPPLELTDVFATQSEIAQAVLALTSREQ